MMLLTLALLATTPVPQNAATVTPAKKDLVVCRGDAVTGSRLAKKPVCKKQSEWAKQDQANSEKVGKDRGGSSPR